MLAKLKGRALQGRCLIGSRSIQSRMAITGSLAFYLTAPVLLLLLTCLLS